MRITSEEQLLDAGIRKKIIEEIEGTENKARKNEHYKRYQCYKDKTNKYVIKQLLKTFDPETVNEMMYAISNIAFVRKAVDKLARVYKYGVSRETENEALTSKLQFLEKELEFNAAMKKTNRFFKLHKNTAVFVFPVNETLEQDSKKCLKVIPLPPHLYDVVEIADNREKAGCFILSDYEPEGDNDELYTLASRKHQVAIRYKSAEGDKVDQLIADAPQDQRNFGTANNKSYVFWTNKYHFTCNAKGEIISTNDKKNPLGEMPVKVFAEDQDGSFWAEGGEDLTDGAILANSMISNINHIAITQGYGQLVMTGKKLPRNQKVGPNKAVLLEYEKEDDPTPTFDFKTANPPLNELRSLVEMYVALLLTTNNLSTSGVSSTLQGGMEFPSGIAMMIDKSESMEDIEDQRQIFLDREPEIWELVFKWEKILKASGQLSDEYSQNILPEETEVKIKFNPPAVIETEKERLENLKLKQDMGLLTKLDLLRSEYPDLTNEQLAQKLAEIIKEKQDAIQSFTDQGNQPGNELKSGSGAAENTTEDSPEDKAGRGGVSSGANS